MYYSYVLHILTVTFARNQKVLCSQRKVLLKSENQNLLIYTQQALLTIKNYYELLVFQSTFIAKIPEFKAMSVHMTSLQYIEWQ